MEEGVGIIRKELIKIVEVCEFIFFIKLTTITIELYRDAKYMCTGTQQFIFGDRKMKPPGGMEQYVAHN